MHALAWASALVMPPMPEAEDTTPLCRERGRARRHAVGSLSNRISREN
jgi:hypothetical protein